MIDQAAADTGTLQLSSGYLIHIVIRDFTDAKLLHKLCGIGIDFFSSLYRLKSKPQSKPQNKSQSKVC